MLTKDAIIQCMKKKGYKLFTGPYNLNLIGIRSKESKSDSFDDTFCVLYENRNKEVILETFPCTTDPGKHYLLNPLNTKGCAIMVPDQYLGVYVVGNHTNYEALRQVKPMKYVRDNNKDSKLDFSLYKDEKNIYTEIALTNIHRASAWKNLLNIGMYSAGCQVIQSPTDFQRLMELAHLQCKSGVNSFSYTLLEETDL